MRIIAALAVLFVAAPAVAEEKKTTWYFYGAEDVGNLSGKPGTEDRAKVQASVTDQEKSSSASFFNLRTVVFAEQSDRPCFLKLDQSPEWTTCRGTAADKEELSLSSETQRFSGVQVCMNGAKDRIKGVRLFVSEYEYQGVIGTLDRKKAQMREFKRPNCDEKDGWMQEQRCKEGSALVGLYIDWRRGQGVGNTSDLITGLTPICRKITTRITTLGSDK